MTQQLRATAHITEQDDAIYVAVIWSGVELDRPFTGGFRLMKGQMKLAQGLQIDKPVLVLHSAKSVDEKKWSDVFFTGDAVLNVGEIALLAQNIVGQYSIQAIPGGMHDLVLSRQPARDEVYSFIFNWAKRVLK